MVQDVRSIKFFIAPIRWTRCEHVQRATSCQKEIKGYVNKIFFTDRTASS